jgi:hypothetical protein
MSILTSLKQKLLTARRFVTREGIIFFAQRRIRRRETRQRIARLIASYLPRSSVKRAGSSRILAELEQEGFAVLDWLVTPAMAVEMHDHFLRHPVYAPYVPNSPHMLIDDVGLPDSHVFWHEDLAVISCPHALDVANHPEVISAVEAALGCKPTIGYMTAWWSVPTADGMPRQTENFHRDVDDLHFIKLFVYLTDVGSENGPHEFVRGSHVDQRLFRIRRYTDEEVRGTFGPDRLVMFTGGAGSAFLENTYGMHRGLPVHAARRLIFQVVYSLLPLVYGPPRPYSLDAAAPVSTCLDPYINRRYVKL